MLLHLPRDLHGKRTLRRSTQSVFDSATAVEGAGANLVVPAEGWCES